GLGIGPVNLVVLSRKKRRIWMLWTVPVISLLTCVAVFGYMLLVEGWEGHLRTEGVTILDESAHRATTLGWTGFYSPFTPSDGLSFGADTELSPQIEDDYSYRSGGTARTIDWTSEQHLGTGWASARTPAHFMVRKSEKREERVTVDREAGGTLAMVNGLGEEIAQFWYADEQGRIHTAGPVPAGSQAALTPAGDQVNAGMGLRGWRQLYT